MGNPGVAEDVQGELFIDACGLSRLRDDLLHRIVSHLLPDPGDKDEICPFRFFVVIRPPFHKRFFGHDQADIPVHAGLEIDVDDHPGAIDADILPLPLTNLPDTQSSFIEHGNQASVPKGIN
jgi:hypothetical protein